MESAIEQTERSLPDRIREKLLALYKLSSDSDLGTGKIAAHAKHLREAYPDVLYWRAYWVFVGGTPEFPDDELRQEDFPGDDSVERFLDILIAEEKKKKE